VFVTPTVEIETETFTDDGRAEVSGEPQDQWRYRTPSLRNAAVTAPYMHDGSLATLQDVVAFYDAGGGGDPQQDPRVRPLGLSSGERDALVAFLASLTGDNVHALAADARSVEIGDAHGG
jgi:cytochrome c peroxidase